MDDVESSQTQDLAPPVAAADRTEPAPEPAPPGRRRWVTRVNAYWIFVVVVIAWGISVTLKHTWVGDWSLHLATVRELTENLSNPADPITGDHTPSPYMSPYVWAIAVAARVFGLTAQSALEAAGVVVLGALLVGFAAVARSLSRRPLVAILAVIFSVSLWGWEPVFWSGFLDLTSFSHILAYPSLAATALMLLSWAALLRRRAIISAALVPLILLIHPFTAVNTMLGLAAFALCDRHWWRIRTLAIPAATGVAALGIAALWPYSSLRLLLVPTPELAQIHAPLYADALAKYGLVLLALPALFVDRRRRHGTALVALFGIALAVVLVGAATGHYELARAIPVMALPAHLALARHLGERAAGKSRHAAYAVVIAVACAAGMLSAPQPFNGLLRGMPRAWSGTFGYNGPWGTSFVARYRPITSELRRGDVVLTDGTQPLATHQAEMSIMIAGAYSVPTAWPDPFDPAWRRREALGKQFFAANTTPARRAAIAARLGARCVFSTRPEPVPGFREITRLDGTLSCRS